MLKQGYLLPGVQEPFKPCWLTLCTKLEPAVETNNRKRLSAEAHWELRCTLITENDSLTLITLGTETGLEFIPHPSHICEYGRVTVATVNETRLTRGVTLKTLSVGKTSDPEKKEIANYSVDLWSDESDSSSVIEYLIILMEQMENRQKKLKSHPVTIVFNVSDTQQAISLCIMNNIMSTISVDKEVEIFNNVRRFQDVLPNVEFTEESFRLFCQLAFVYLESIGVYTNI
ncbi:uncharacterized protein LOC121387185 [Gigantopelta aegis]|uniref:uncharacterized protein LOC121387185 n=1 Tax=Gigantopelta aegis TaxID=1735272 RepID=UPI001B88C8BF|nr:uncharacterized protein LOC121387185 [Gigantopelta aegis]